MLNQDGKLMDLVDPKLNLHSNETAEAQRVIHTGLLCLRYAEEMRPPMSRVVNLLQGDASSESDVSANQPGVPPTGRGINILGFDTVPPSGSTNGSGSGSQRNHPWFRGLPSDISGSKVSSASDVKLISIGTSTASAR